MKQGRNEKGATYYDTIIGKEKERGSIREESEKPTSPTIPFPPSHPAKNNPKGERKPRAYCAHGAEG